MTKLEELLASGLRMPVVAVPIVVVLGPAALLLLVRRPVGLWDHRA